MKKKQIQTLIRKLEVKKPILQKFEGEKGRLTRLLLDDFGDSAFNENKGILEAYEEGGEASWGDES